MAGAPERKRYNGDAVLEAISAGGSKRERGEAMQPKPMGRKSPVRRALLVRATASAGVARSPRLPNPIPVIAAGCIDAASSLQLPHAS
jgi:hypothetical protein